MSNKASLTSGRQKKKDSTKELRANLGQLQGALLNMRQMYDSKVMEVQALQTAIGERDLMLAGVLEQLDGSVTLSNETLDAIKDGAYGRIEIDFTDDGLVLTLEEPDEDE